MVNKIGWDRFVQVVVLGTLVALSLVVPRAVPALEIAPVGRGEVVHQVSPLDSLTLPPTGDATLLEAHPTTNYGIEDSDGLILGRIDGGRARALIGFNIGEIPLGATIDSATLRIYQAGWSDYEDSVRTIYADRVTSAWHEAVATWNYAPTIGPTVGSVSVGMGEGWYEIDLTALVQEWYAGATPNYGLLLRGHEGSQDLYRLFIPRLYVNHPELVVEYTLNPTTLSVSTNAIRFLTDGQKMAPASSTLRISNSGTGVVNWAIDLGSTPWLQVAPLGGFTSASYPTPVEVVVLTDTLSAGIHTAPITIVAPGAQGSPQVIQVTVHYSSDPLSEIYTPLIVNHAIGEPGPGDGSKAVALLIGIADYLYLDPPPAESVRTGDWGYDLEYTSQDPQHFRQALIAFADVNSEDTRTLRDAEASLAGIEQAIEWADEREEQEPCALTGLQAQSCDPNLALVGYSGHGGQDVAGRYLITAYDTDESGDRFVNAISGPALDGWLDELDAQNVFVTIDACKSGGLLSNLSQSGRVVIASARSDQSAWETSQFNGCVFTHYLVQGLMDPSADANGDRCVSAEEAYAYAADRTDAYTLDSTGFHQNPQMYDGVPGELCLTWPPIYGPMASGPVVLSDADERAQVVHFSRDLVPLPRTLTPVR